MLKIYRIADHWIEYCFQHPDTARYFERFEVDADIPAGEPVIPVQASPLFIEQSAVKRGHTYSTPERAEYEALASATSAALLPYGAFLFHSAAFTYRGKAIVYTGPSGIGKTTQYAQWKRLYRDEVKIISGDMNAIVFQKDGQVSVMPSAWNGKESLRSNASAPLGAIILLEQTSDNTIRRLESIDCILPIYSQICLDRMEKSQIEGAFALEDQLLRKIPIWKLSSRGDLDSARLCHDTMEGEIYG